MRATAYSIYLFFFLSTQLISQSYQDCEQAQSICQYGSYLVDEMIGFGSTQEQFQDLSCSNSNWKETNSSWFKFTALSAGTVTFIINPNSKSDDLDFILFEANKGMCDQLNDLRCMASGLNMSTGRNDNPCIGSTGIRLNSNDVFERAGCQYNDDNFLKYLKAETGETYYLLVNNYNATSGFVLSIEGEAELLDKACITPNLKSSLEVYPNPTNSFLSIDLSVTQSIKEAKIDIVDFTGKKISSRVVDLEAGQNIIELDLADMVAGNYAAMIDIGQTPLIKQFVKQ